MNEALELHDSVVSFIEQSGSSVIVEFESAYIHRTAGRPGLDHGDVLLQAARLVFRKADVTGEVARCRGSLSAGVVNVQADALSLIPVPFDDIGVVRCQLVFVTGEVVNIEGRGFSCSVHGEATFLERFVA